VNSVLAVAVLFEIMASFLAASSAAVAGGGAGTPEQVVSGARKRASETVRAQSLGWDAANAKTTFYVSEVQCIQKKGGPTASIAHLPAARVARPPSSSNHTTCTSIDDM
jgi:hypothetical protein